MNSFQLDDLAIRYDNNVFIPFDVFGDWIYFYSLLAKSDFIPFSDSKLFVLVWQLEPSLSYRYHNLQKDSNYVISL